jgi:hypothetical protein
MTTFLSFFSSAIPVLESPASCCDSQMIPTLRATSRQSVLTLYDRVHGPVKQNAEANANQKIRTIELDGKTVKLQIVSLAYPDRGGYIASNA